MEQNSPPPLQDGPLWWEGARRVRLLEVHPGTVQSFQNLPGRGAGGEVESKQAGHGGAARDHDEHAQEANNRGKALHQE